MEHFIAKDKKKIYFQCWLPENAPKSILQIVHGMAEHSGSYDELANILTKSGIAVFANDHRGHGKTAENDEEYGYWQPDIEWQKVMQDIYQFTGIIKERLPELPMFILGHSMGSFLVRDYISQWGKDISGAVISATDGSQGLLAKIGLLMVRLECKKYGAKHPSKMMSNMTFRKYNRKFKPNRTGYDWLTRDEQKVDEYIADKRCGGVFSCGFYYEILKNTQKLHTFKNARKIPADLPVLFLTGERDPLSDNGKRVWDIINLFESSGIRDVESIFYADCRHDLKLELSREMIFSDISDWINDKLGK